ncbi:MAG TPA: metalloregulator ArsR/SmtB family transcription factor [Candidatus Binataceae bacterium]|jgi:DNA-binding transcriptional ArsR family regulator|nr:metalloregulator ArsR/SmtB family transcription factor [Candidatus Binataceae bacterium]
MTPDLNLTFSALADPTRRAILARLASGDATVHTLAAPFAISGPAISRHLKVLERAGLIARSRDAQWRPCRLAAAPLKDAAAWLERYRLFWEASFDRLEDYLREVQGTPESSPPAPQIPRKTGPAPRRSGKPSARRRKNPKGS